MEAMLDGRPVFLAADEGTVWDVLGEQVIAKLTGEQTGGRYSVFLEVSTQPGGGPPLHVHSREEESFLILEGRYEFRCGDQTFVAEPGAFVRAPVGMAHTFRNANDGPSKMLVTVAPAGFENFFRAIHEAGGTPPIPQVLAIGEKAGLTFLPEG